MNPIRWPAPAKLNLFLHFIGRRADGYHELQTLFVILDVGDELQISVRTVEVHRSSLLDKMGVRSAVELAQKLATGATKPAN